MPYILSPYIYVYNIPKSEKFPSVTEAEGAPFSMFFFTPTKACQEIIKSPGIKQ